MKSLSTNFCTAHAAKCLREKEGGFLFSAATTTIVHLTLFPYVASSFSFARPFFGVDLFVFPVPILPQDLCQQKFPPLPPPEAAPNRGGGETKLFFRTGGKGEGEGRGLPKLGE